MKKKIVGIIGVILIILIVLYCIDRNRMKNNQPVFFSTWGYQYVPSFETKKEFIPVVTPSTNEKYNYSVYIDTTQYYLNFNYKGKMINLKEELIMDKININDILEQIKEDVKEKKVTKKEYIDGEYFKYEYPEYSIIVCNTKDGNKDIYIGNQDMKVEDIK